MPHIICKAQPALVRGYFADDDGDQIFIICKPGAEQILGMRIKDKDTFLIEGSMKFLRYLTEEEIKSKEIKVKPFNSNKTQIGVCAAWGIVGFGFAAWKFLGVPADILKIGVGAVTAIVCTHLIGHAITDASASFGKGESK